LLTLANLAPLAKRRSAILAPWIIDLDLASKIAQLRNAGEVVIQAMNADVIETAEYCLDRELVKQGNSWEVKNT
jgi:ATP phosphoribosyltransferase regulatory subunit